MSGKQASVRPLVGIPTSIIKHSQHSIVTHGVSQRYIEAVRHGSGADPLLVPALGDALDIAALAGRLDGLFLTGGRANVEPHHYGGPPFPHDEPRDPPRDATALPLIRACVARRVPVFGVCRGLQELNVALGGSLHYRVHLVDGKLDHRMPRDGDVDHKFGLRHVVRLTEGGLFADLVGVEEVMVNSAHGQGIDRLAPGLAVEATAPDGIVEGVRIAAAGTFVVAVQWHAEHRYGEHALSLALFRAFGAAAGEHARARTTRIQAA